MWEFAGGKTEEGETKEGALRRECFEELGVSLSGGSVFAEVVHQYPDVTIRLTLFNASLSEGVPQISSYRTTRQKRFFRFFCRAVFLTEFSPHFFENLDRVSEKCYTESGNRIKISKVLFIFSANAKQEEFPIEDR